VLAGDDVEAVEAAFERAVVERDLAPGLEPSVKPCVSAMPRNQGVSATLLPMLRSTALQRT
jgi:hypothetical protein